jgi:hypothetical protein
LIMGHGILGRIADFHMPDKSVPDLVDVLHRSLQQRVAVLIQHALLNFDHSASVRLGHEGLGFNKRVDETLLMRPVRAHAVVSMNVSTLHAVGPLHIWVHH